MKNVWDAVPRLAYKLVVSSQWPYKVKKVEYNSVEKHNTMFVARECSEVERIDYDETFSPLTRYLSITSHCKHRWDGIYIT